MRSIAIQVVRKPENGHDILNLNYVQMRVSGYINQYVTVMLADAKAKTVTSLLTQLTVLVHAARLPPCHGLRSYHPRVLLANGLANYQLDYKVSPFATQMQVTKNVSCVTKL